jgi:hypothetical protein
MIKNSFPHYQCLCRSKESASNPEGPLCVEIFRNFFLCIRVGSLIQRFHLPRDKTNDLVEFCQSEIRTIR